jgi:hypothetical protein
MSGEIVVMLVTVTAALFLAVRGLQSHGLSFERKAWMAAAWVAIIAALAFILQRWSA